MTCNNFKVNDKITSNICRSTREIIISIYDLRFKNSIHSSYARSNVNLLTMVLHVTHSVLTHAHSTSACYTRLTHVRRVRGVRAERGGMRYGILLFVPLSLSLSLSLSPPLRLVWVTRKMMRIRMRREMKRIHLIPPTLDPHLLSTPPPPGILLSRDPPPPFSQPYSTLFADSRTHLPPVPTLGALAPDVTSRASRRTPVTSRSPKRASIKMRSVCTRTAYVAVSRVQASYAQGTTRSFSDDNNTTTMLVRVLTFNLIVWLA